MNYLLRELAPLSTAAWEMLDNEARSALRPSLAARRLVDVEGPAGWEHSATNLGRAERLEKEPAAGVGAKRRVVLPLVELRVDLSLSLQALHEIDRGADDVDLGPLDDAAHRLAVAENVVVLQGYEEAGITGIVQASTHAPIRLGREFASYPRQVARAVATLRGAGVEGPYALALGPDGYTGVVETAEHGGLLLLDHLRQILGGPVLWAPGIEGAVALSTRGGDFHLDLGSDIALGYAGHDADQVHLYLEESLAFRVSSREAALALQG